MDRQTVYPAQILPETVLLQMAKDFMIGLAKLSSAMFGASTMANGFAVTPTGPASLQVLIAPGEIYSLTGIDATAYSSLAADTTHFIMKQGILLDGLTLNCPAPGTTGQSINYLIEATYQDLDANPALLPYYNSANPALPFSGMGNNGLTQNTSRKGAAVVQVKAGASAATGSQTTPAPDAGYVGLYVVTVAFGQTAITSTSISQYASAPLLPSGIVPAIQSNALTAAQDFGTAGAYKANYYPAITSLTNNMILEFEVLTANPGSATFSPNGITPWPVIGGAHSALQGGEFVAGGKAEVMWHSTLNSWVLLGCTGGAMQVGPATKSQHAANAGQIQTQSLTAFTSTGTAPAFILTPVPAITAYAATQCFQVTFSAAGGATPTLNVSGIGAKNLKQYDSGGNKVSAVITSGQVSDVVYDGTDFVVLDQLPSIGLVASSITTVATTGTLATTVGGGTVLGNSASATTQTLIGASTIRAGVRIEFMNINSGSMTIARAGTDTIQVNASTVTSIALGAGDTLTLESNGANGWYAVGGTAQLKSAALFGSSLAANSWQRLPSGFLIQAGTYAAGVTSVTLPLACPVALISVVIANTANTTSNAPGVYNFTTAGFSSTSSSLTSSYIAIGY
jgi:hypothetical protein